MSQSVIAERTFTIDGLEVRCSFEQPQSDGLDFYCVYEIDWPEGPKRRRIFGVDSVRALLLAMQAAHVDLLVQRERNGRAVTWYSNLKLDLPISRTIEDWDPDGTFAPG
jgi:hypothetical protein